jgi:hypothetical protein
MVDREKMLSVRVADTELAMLKELSEHLGLKQSDVVRQLIRNAHAKAGLETQPKRKRS